MSSYLDNPRSDRVRKVRGLSASSARRRHGLLVAEGPQSAREAVRCAAVRDLYLTEDAAEKHPEIVDEARQRGHYLHLCSPDVLRAMSADAQGVLAVVENREPGPMPDSPHLVAVFAELQDPGNAGTAIRAADAAGADAVILSAGSVDVTNPKVVRASAGSLFHLPVLSGRNLDDVVPELKRAGLRVLAADARGDVSLADLLQGDGEPTAWLFGNEARGLSADLTALADATVRIPMPGRAESLNLAQAATLCLFATAFAQHS